MGAIDFKNPALLGLTGGTRGLGGLTVNPTHVAGVETTNPYNISIPQNHSYTTDESGNKISLGQDGVGLAHKNPDEYGLHVIA